MAEKGRERKAECKRHGDKEGQESEKRRTREKGREESGRGSG